MSTKMNFGALAFLQGSSSGGLIGLLPFILIFVILYFLLIRPRQKRERQAVAERDEQGTSGSAINPGVALWSIVGIFVGSLVGFLFRPSAPLIGQLPFEYVIARGSNLRGVDQILVSVAQSSFNYLVFGGIVGGLIAGFLGYSLSKKKQGMDAREFQLPMGTTNSTATRQTQAIHQDAIPDRIRRLAGLKNDGVITEEEFQTKKTELLSQM